VEKDTRFKKEQWDANQRHIAEKARRADLLKSEDTHYIPPVIFGEENRQNNSQKEQNLRRFREDLQGQIREREKSRKDKQDQDARDDTMPGMKFGEFQDRYAAMKDRYILSLKEQLMEKEARNKLKEGEKQKDMDRLRKDIRRQIDEEKAEKKGREKYKRDFYAQENSRMAQNKEVK
jgi:hypothetical protein